MRLFVTKSAAGAELVQLAGRQRKDLPLEVCELEIDTKALKSGDKPVTFSGYGSVWGRTDSHGDTLHKGAFADSLKTRRPIMLLGHNPQKVPGKWLSAVEDNKGLKLTGELTPGHSLAQDLGASLAHGALTGLSIGGYTKESTPKHPKNPYAGRDITKFDLYEVSAVAMPAEQEARIDTASVKAMLDQAQKLSDFEDILRDAGMSKTAAAAWVSRFAAFVRGEPDTDAQLKKAADDALAEVRALKIPHSLLES